MVQLAFVQLIDLSFEKNPICSFLIDEHVSWCPTYHVSSNFKYATIRKAWFFSGINNYCRGFQFHNCFLYSLLTFLIVAPVVFPMVMCWQCCHSCGVPHFLYLSWIVDATHFSAHLIPVRLWELKTVHHIRAHLSTWHSNTPERSDLSTGPTFRRIHVPRTQCHRFPLLAVVRNHPWCWFNLAETRARPNVIYLLW